MPTATILRKRAFRTRTITSDGRPWRSMTGSGCSSRHKNNINQRRDIMGKGWRNRLRSMLVVCGLCSITVMVCSVKGECAPTFQPEYGGTLTVAVEADSRGFDPIKAGFLSAQARSAAMAIEERLFDMDAKGKLVPELGLSANSSKDGKSWTIKLRKGVS